MSSRPIVALLLTACVLGSVSPANAQSRRITGTGFVDEITLDRYGLTRRWYTQVPTLRLREKVLGLKLQEDLLFVATDKGVLHCLDAETGAIRWTQNVSSVPGEVFPPALTKNFVYVCSGSQYAQLDRASGQVIRTQTLPSAATSGPAANTRFCYVQTIENRIYAISLSPDPEDQDKQWPNKRKFTLPYSQWFFDAGSPLANSPIIYNDRVIFTSRNGVVFASVLDERKLYYRFIPGGKIIAPVSFRDRTLYVATVDNNLYAVDVVTGEARWRFPSGYPIYDRAVPFEKDVLLTPSGGGLFAVDDQTGFLRWISESATRVVSVSQDRVYAMTDAHRMLVIDREDGATVGSWFSPDFPLSAYNQTNDRIVQSTERGLVQCLAEKTNVTPFPHQSPPEEEPLPTLDTDSDVPDSEPSDADPSADEDF